MKSISLLLFGLAIFSILTVAPIYLSQKSNQAAEASDIRKCADFEVDTFGTGEFYKIIQNICEDQHIIVTIQYQDKDKMKYFTSSCLYHEEFQYISKNNHKDRNIISYTVYPC